MVKVATFSSLLCSPLILAVLQEMHGPNAPDLVPQQPQQLQQLEDINSWVYTDLANGAYKAGFASSQLAYETAYKQFFVALDRAEALLAKHK
jgi:putative glutathione S-transferase